MKLVVAPDDVEDRNEVDQTAVADSGVAADTSNSFGSRTSIDNAITSPAKKVAAPPLTGKRAPWMEQALGDVSRVQAWLESYGSPLHVTVLSEFKNNIENLQKPLHERNIKGGLFFARKANKLPWFVKEANTNKIGVDTASLGEVEETLSLGVPAEKIVVTAIGKSRKLVTRSIESGCLLVLDNYDELELVEQVASSLGKTARVGLRFSGFKTDYRTVFSRFGFPVNDAIRLAKRVSISGNLELEIFHAHIDKYRTDERASAAIEMIRIIDQLASEQINIKGIDLGGGILINYLEHESQWRDYLIELERSVLGYCPSFNFDGDGLGLRKAGDNNLEGDPELYPFWNPMPKSQFVESVLDTVVDGKPLHKHFSQRALELYFEPGRAMLDNTAITFAPVSYRKKDTGGNLLIGLAMNRMNLRPFRAEFCVDPIVLSNGKREPLTEPATIVGSLCSESDLIYKRLLRLDTMPLSGDVFCFPNSAGYLAHHMEIGTHGDPLPTNILVDPASFEVLDNA